MTDKTENCMKTCPFRMIAYAHEPTIDPSCVRERCMLWDECLTRREGIVIKGGFRSGCCFIPRENRREW